MDEHRAAAPGHARPRVVVDLHNEVIERVGAREAIGFAAARHFDRPVVMAIGGILAPAVVRLFSLRRQSGGRARVPLGAPPQPLEPESPARGCAVAFALIGFDAAAVSYTHL